MRSRERPVGYLRETTRLKMAEHHHRLYVFVPAFYLESRSLVRAHEVQFRIYLQVGLAYVAAGS